MRNNTEELVLFDGVCNLCERSVLFIVRHDSGGHFQFCSLQSPAAQTILDEHEYNDDALASVLLLSKGELYTRSRAALHIVKRLDGAWPAFYYLFFWVPTFFADPLYNFIGKRRYKWFGRKDACWVPDAELRQRFIDS